jgi:RHS repeat-associated protein
VWDAVSGGNQLQNTVIEQVGGIKTNRIASVNGTAFSYDASGNLTGDGARALTYDAMNRLVSVSGLTPESYGYDAANRRVKTEAGGVVTHYIWEGGQVIAEYERGGAATPATGTRYYHRDRMSTRVITDGAGNVVGTMDHLPFGEEIGGSGEKGKHKFTTYERDGTGFDYAMNRHYLSAQGRFAQSDPLGIGAASLENPQSLNLYSYVQNNPVNFVDPTGLLIAFCDARVIGQTFIEGIGDAPVYLITCEIYGGGGGGGPIMPIEPPVGGGGVIVEPPPAPDCAKMLADLIVKAGKLVKEFGKYDPVADGKGGHTYYVKGQQRTTKPGGHFQEINDLQRGIRNDINKYIKACIDKDKNGGGGGGAPVPEWIEELATRPVDPPVIPRTPDNLPMPIPPPPRIPWWKEIFQPRMPSFILFPDLMKCIANPDACRKPERG